MELVLKNGKIYVERGVFAQALLARDGVIQSVGTDAEVLAQAAPGAQVIDCGGRTVIPGLNDCHLHLKLLGQKVSLMQIEGLTSLEETVQGAKRFLEEHPELCKNGLLGMGWNEELFTDEKRPLNRHDLDRISTEIPIVLERICGHVGVCNTFAIKALGMDEHSPQIEGGLFETEPSGYPTGIFKEKALYKLSTVIPNPTVEENVTYFVRGMEHAVRLGITSVQSNDVSRGAAPTNEECFEMIHRVFDQGLAKLRYRVQMCFDTPDDLRKCLADGELKHGDYSHPWLEHGPLKLFKDGALGGRTAMMKNGYLDVPSARGVERTSKALMDEYCAIAAAAGMQIATHVIGDRAISDVIDSYEKVMPDGKNPLRHILIHTQITDRPLLERIARDDLTVSYQPIFLNGDMHIVLPRCGEQLSSTSYAFRTLGEMGVHIGYSTDSPFEDCNPFRNIYSAVTRRDLSGFPEGGFFPQECVDVSTALDAYTSGSAYLEFHEGDKGRLKPGFFADMAVLDRDIFTCDPMEIKDILPVMTIVDGKIMFSTAL